MTAPGPSYPLEEYVPPGYGPVALPADLQRCWAALFGTAPDRAALNLRLRELQGIVHGTPELAPYATALDPRVTYWPPAHRRGFRALVFGAAATQTAGPASAGLTFQGSTTNLTTGGPIYLTWTVTVNSPTQVTVAARTPPYGVSVQAVPGTVGFPGAPLLAVPTNPVAGAAWEVQALLRPVHDLAAAYRAARALGSPPVLFAPAPGTPFADFLAVWESAAPPPLALGVFALALGWRTNQLYGGA